MSSNTIRQYTVTYVLQIAGWKGLIKSSRIGGDCTNVKM